MGLAEEVRSTVVMILTSLLSLWFLKSKGIILFKVTRRVESLTMLATPLFKEHNGKGQETVSRIVPNGGLGY
jgi:hypothetical protein